MGEARVRKLRGDNRPNGKNVKQDGHRNRALASRSVPLRMKDGKWMPSARRAKSYRRKLDGTLERA